MPTKTPAKKKHPWRACPSLRYLRITAILLSFFCVSESSSEESAHYARVRVSATGKINMGLSKGMRYRVRLTSMNCSRLDETPLNQNQIRPTIRLILRRERRRFLSQLRTWEFMPESNQLAVATLSNDARCYPTSSMMMSLSNIFQEDLPFEKPRHFVRTAVLITGSTKLLTLRDVFPPAQFNSALKRISNFVTAELRKQLLVDGEEAAVIDWIERGTTPLENSFDKFVLTRDGMRIFFEEYQVAAYAHGVMEVLIPWTILTPLVFPDISPLVVPDGGELK